MLDFGPTTAIDDAGAPNSLINSPYHTVNGTFTETSWNKVQLADVAAGGLVWSDGTTAAGMSLNLGGVSGASTTLTLGTAPSSALAGTAVKSTAPSVYIGTSVGRDGIFMTGAGTPSVSSVGFQLSGIGAGQYDVYLLMRQTNTVVAHSQIGYVSTAAAAGNFDYSAYASKTVSFGAGDTPATSAWVEDANYVKFTVTLGASDVLNLAVTGPVSTAERRGFLNAVQIVPVPEPTAGAAVLTLLGATLMRRRANR